MQANYHTHTRRCHHAYGSDEQFVKQAIQEGFQQLGFSDHACWKYKSNYRSRIRMTVKEFDDYRRSIQKLQKKYEDQIDIMFGMEAEYFPEYMDWMLDFCIDQDIDYLIFGNHYLGSDEYGPYCGSMSRIFADQYFDTCIAGMKTGMYSYLAHPELLLRDGRGWDQQVEAGFRRVCEAAREQDIPLEFNCLGMAGNDRAGFEMYPHHKFWEMAADLGCKAIIGMDAHSPDDLDVKRYRRARNYLEKLGIEIVETIPKTDFRAVKEALKKEKALAASSQE